MHTTVMFRNLPPNPSLQAAAERWVTRLEQVSDGIIGCHVSVEKPHHHRLHASPVHVNIIVVIPSGQIAVTSQLNQDAYVALADAFRAARRQLLDRAGAQPGFVKAGGSAQVGLVANKH